MLKVALQFSAVDDMQDLEYEQRLRTPSSVSSFCSVSSVSVQIGWLHEW